MHVCSDAATRAMLGVMGSPEEMMVLGIKLLVS